MEQNTEVCLCVCLCAVGADQTYAGVSLAEVQAWPSCFVLVSPFWFFNLFRMAIMNADKILTHANPSVFTGLNEEAVRDLSFHHVLMLRNHPLVMNLCFQDAEGQPSGVVCISLHASDPAVHPGSLPAPSSWYYTANCTHYKSGLFQCQVEF